MKNNTKKTLYYTFILILLISLSFLFIYTGDDWAWGSEIGLSRLQTLFKNYNGRYLGNIIVLLLTRSNFLKGIIIGSTLFAIIMLLYKISNKKRFDTFLLTTILILNTPKLIFREAISWTSGFSNYATSTLFMLIFIYYIKNIQTQKISNSITIKTFLLLLLGIASSLFIENFTLYNLLLSIFILIYHKSKHKELNKNLLSYNIGSLIGFIIMFSNLSTSTSGQRQISNSLLDLILRACNNYFGIIYEEIIYHNVIINILLMLFIFFMIKKTKTNKLQKISFNLSLSYVFYSILNLIYPSWNIFLKYTPHFEGIFTIFYTITTTYLLIILIKDNKLRERIIFYITSIIILTLPLLVVSPIGSRLFFITYIIFILIVIELYNNLIKNEIKSKYLHILIIISFIHLFSINITTYIENNIRLKEIEKYIIKNETIELERFTYEDYIHGEATPTPNTIWEERYKLFYKIPNNLNIIIKEKELDK